MSIERFHTVCDRCGSKGQEYAAHVIACRDCGDDVCKLCAAEYDPDPPGFALCRQCNETTTHGEKE